MELTSLDLHYVTKELQSIVGAKVEKIYQSESKRDVLFALYVKDAPKMNLRFLLPGMVCSVKDKPSYPQMPPGFAVFLRKYLGGTRIQSVQQAGFDRILNIGFASKTEAYSLVVEMFHPGNMLLLDGEGRIINLLENQQFKDRVLRGRQLYVAPPPSYDIITATDAELADRISVSTKDSIVTALAIGFSLGGVYAEEACARASIAKHRNDLSAAEVNSVVAAEQPAQKAEAKQKALPQSKTQAIIDAQRQQVTRFEQDAVSEQRKGERIFEEYQLLQEILHAVQDARAKKHDIHEAIKPFSQVKSYKDATGEIEIELEDA